MRDALALTAKREALDRCGGELGGVPVEFLHPRCGVGEVT